MDLQTWIFITILCETLLYITIIKMNTQPNLELWNIKINNLLMRLHNLSLIKFELEENIENYSSHLDEKQNDSIKNLIETLKSQLEYAANILDDNNYITSPAEEPSSDYEQLRRRIRQNIQEMWNYFSSELETIPKNTKVIYKIAAQVGNALELGADYKRSIIANIDGMYLVDGYELWRQNTAKNLSDLVERRINYTQNPKDCENAKKLLCSLKQQCGLACQLHQIMHCFMAAYATSRTLIIISKDWSYQDEGWKEIFQPISETCTEYDIEQKTFRRRSKDFKLLFFADIYLFESERSYLPLHIPADLAPNLKKFQGDPSVWWISQFSKYLLKPKHATQKMIKTNMKTLSWQKPALKRFDFHENIGIVRQWLSAIAIYSVHIRRTDKDSEAEFHSVEEYMKYVEDYYLTLEMNNKKVERRIFLATDDPHVIEEARTKYPQYTVIANPDAAEKANISTRYTKSSLYGILSDIHMLSLSDYLVCTFSSQVCRIAYEIMQNYYPDASDRIKSLDDIYFFPDQNEHNLKVILLHEPRNKYEIRIQPGDLIHVAGNHWNGFSKGKNRRSHKIGLYPSFKVIDVIETFKIPLYLNVD